MEAESQAGVSPSLVSICVESILYGVLIVLSSVAIVILIHRRRLYSSTSPGRKAHTGVLLVASAMFLIASIHIVASLYRILTPTDPPNKSSDDSVYSLRDTPYIIKISAYFAQTMLGDGFWLYRLHVVWNGDKRVTYPVVLLLVSNAVTSVKSIKIFTEASASGPSFNEIADWIIAFVTLSLATSVGCTVMIAMRVWHIHRNVSRRLFSPSGYAKLPAFSIVIIESGALYCISLIICLSIFLCDSDRYVRYDTTHDVLTPIIG